MQFLNDVPKIAKHHANNASHTPNSGPSAMTMPFKLNVTTNISLFLTILDFACLKLPYLALPTVRAKVPLGQIAISIKQDHLSIFVSVT